jgi:hypothetical protein
MSGRSGYTEEGGDSIMRGHVLLLLPRRKCRYLASALYTTVEFEVPPWPVGVISVVLFSIIVTVCQASR